MGYEPEGQAEIGRKLVQEYKIQSLTTVRRATGEPPVAGAAACVSRSPAAAQPSSNHE